MRSKTVMFVLALVIQAAMPSPSRAEVKKGMLSVAVTDPAGKSVPNATVSIKNGSGETTKAQAASPGFYNALDLPPGDYEVTVTAAGFAAGSASVTLAAEGAQRIDLTLATAKDSSKEQPAAAKKASTPARFFASVVRYLKSFK